MSRQDVKPGTRFGSLTVQGLVGWHVEPSGHRRRIAHVLCDCGQERDICTIYLTRGGTQKCPSCSQVERHLIPIGARFGHLTVVGYESVKGRSKILCLCDCGTPVQTRTERLQKNKTHSCGCVPNGKWGGEGELSLTFYHRIKRGALLRELSFDVTAAQVWSLFLKQDRRCKLSGLPIYLSRDNRKPSTASLDRINSSLGYTEDNIQWVHKDVNLMKMDLPQERFFELCQLVTEIGRRASGHPPVLDPHHSQGSSDGGCHP